MTRQYADTDQIPMLPRNVECVQIKQVRVPSLPRLQIFDDFSVGIRKPTYLFLSRVFPMKKGVSVPADGELHTYWVNMAVALGENIGQQIQAAPKAIDDQPSFGIYNRWQPPNVGELVELLAVLRVHLSDQFVWGEFLPGINSRFKNWDLGVGPLDPSTNV
jgi:hypothetical protein